MPLSLTPAQHSAIHDHDENLVVVAGAGSGKTFVLVERYLALLERNPDWPLSALVAVTFTQKAAGEMRDRVRRYLQTRAEMSPEAERRLAAMDSARIDTIHGFCATILRGNAAEAGVDPGFTVLDEIEAAVLLDDALDDTFRTLAADDPALALFTEYGERAVREEIARLLPMPLELPPGDLFAYWLDEWMRHAHAQTGIFQERIREIECFEPVGADTLSSCWQVCAQVIDWFAAQAQPARLIDYLEQIDQIAALRLPGNPAKVWGEDGAAAKAALRAIRDLAKGAQAAVGSPPGPADQRAARLLPLWLALVARVRQAYQAAKDERGALDFDDLETRTRDLLRDHEDVRARYRGAEFRHLLVDEFQDTNAAQWEIIGALAAPEQPGRLFVVGDPKQSIYGFRGADVSVFERVRREIGRQIDLDTSFRTHGRLVECLNDLFARLLLRDPDSPVSAYQVEYATMQANRRDAPCADPALELLLLDTAKLPDKDEDQAARKWEARVVARRIKELVRAGRPVYDKQQGSTRPIGYGDVALLFQAMTHVTLYEEAFKAEGIPYLTVAGKGYYDRQEVWDVLNLLRALYNPADNLSLAAALRSPLFGLSDDALLALRLVRDAQGAVLPLWDALDQPEAVPADEVEVAAFARDTLRDLRRKAGRVPVADLLRRALEATGYLAVLTGLPDGARRRGNVEKLVEKAETSGRLTLSAFTQYLSDRSEAREGEAVLENEGAVQLMSVHKSKGLEFPLVALVDTAYSRSGGAEGLVNGRGCKVYDDETNQYVATFAYRRAAELAGGREQAERLRLLYVAATRAQDYLLVSGQVKLNAAGTLTAGGWLGHLLDLLTLREVAPQGAQTVTYPWGEAQVAFPAWIDRVDDPPENADDWQPAAAGAVPRLLRPVSAEIPLRSLTATQIAYLGSAVHAGEQRAYYVERWRRSAYHDAPTHIDAVVRSVPKKVGEIVHRALRWPLPSDAGELAELLRRYAWEEHVVDELANREVVKRALQLLEQIRRSEVFAEIDRALQVHREVPFVYQSGAHTIHGVIDLLLQGADGRWRIIDYKTNWLGGAVTDAQLADYTRRYHVQMGVYAAAVRELVESAPLVYIHYIRYARTVMIQPEDWQNARLDEYIEMGGRYG